MTPMLVGQLVTQRLRCDCPRHDLAQRCQRSREITVLSGIDPQMQHGVSPLGNVETPCVFVEQLERRVDAANPYRGAHDGGTHRNPFDGLQQLRALDDVWTTSVGSNEHSPGLGSGQLDVTAVAFPTELLPPRLSRGTFIVHNDQQLPLQGKRHLCHLNP